MPSKSAKHRKALREIAISNLKKDRNFFVVGLTYGCPKTYDGQRALKAWYSGTRPRAAASINTSFG